MPEDIRTGASSGEALPQEHGIVILLPVFNDWQAAELLLADMDATLAGAGLSAEVLFVDDASTLPMPESFARQPFRALRRVEVLHLRRNLGHQRAIAVGLVFVYEKAPCRAVIVMDCDGEDRPADIPALLDEFERHRQACIIFAARRKRLENLLFRFFYHVYRGVHRVITGDAVRVGNFSVVPFDSLSRLVVVPEIWYHYAAAVVRSRLLFHTVPLARGRRLAGKSKMNFIALLLHGLSAFFVYGDIIGARLLVGIALALIVEAAIIAAWLGFSSLATILGIVLLQAIPIALILVFTVVASRVNVAFLPLRDCHYFVRNLERRYP